MQRNIKFGYALSRGRFQGLEGMNTAFWSKCRTRQLPIISHILTEIVSRCKIMSIHLFSKKIPRLATKKLYRSALTGSDGSDMQQKYA
jgi:hypothetical protein